MAQDFTIIALLAAYNEEDIVGQVVGDLLRQDIQVYLLDHGSTDATVKRVQRFVGRGVVGIESLAAPQGEVEVRWGDVLRRKQELAQTLAADWFVHQDADEFRESPWPELNLSQAIRRVDRLGYNAIDFELLNFWPTRESVRPGQDVRKVFRHYERGQPYDKLQVRCWKKTAGAVDLVASGGHDATFAGRRVFPLRFLLRHYPLRGQAHGERKIYRERVPRFAAEEVARGWHLQYRGVASDQSFVRAPETLTEYDAEAVRVELALRHRGVEELEARLGPLSQELSEERERGAASRSALLAERTRAERLSRDLDLRNRELLAERERAQESSRSLDARNRELLAEHERAEELSRSLDARNRQLSGEHERAETLSRKLDEEYRGLLAERERAEVLSGQLDARNRQVSDLETVAQGLRADADVRRRQVAELLTSRSWRWTAPLRAAQRLLRGMSR